MSIKVRVNLEVDNEWNFEGSSLKCYEYTGQSDTDKGIVEWCPWGCMKIQDHRTGLFIRYANQTKANFFEK